MRYACGIEAANARAESVSKSCGKRWDAVGWFMAPMIPTFRLGTMTPTFQAVDDRSSRLKDKNRMDRSLLLTGALRVVGLVTLPSPFIEYHWECCSSRRVGARVSMSTLGKSG